MRYIFILLLILSAALYAQNLRCSICGKEISGKYIASKDKPFCSQKCFEKTLPPCSVCGKKLLGEYLILEGKKFCSKKCMQNVQAKCDCCSTPLEGTYHFVLVNGKKKNFCLQCDSLPHCFVCNFPSRTHALPDGRHLCQFCSKDTIRSGEEAQMIADRVQADLNTLLPRKCTCRIQIRLLNQQNFNRAVAQTKIRRPSNSALLGLFRWEEHYKSNGDGKKYNYRKKEYICILSHIPRDRFKEVAAHELAHHWQQHLYPNIEDSFVKEGFAEYAASLINSKYNNSDLNERMRVNPDPVYGEGYRYLCRIAKEKSWPGILQYLAAHQKK